MTPNQFKALIVNEVENFCDREIEVVAERDSSDSSRILVDVSHPSDNDIYRHIIKTLSSPDFFERLNDGLA
jgi:hypothetical protein